MNIQTFITQCADQSFLDKHPVIIFTGSSYPTLFFRLLIDRLKDHTALPISTIVQEQPDFEKIKGQLSVSFLSQRLLYWGSNVSAYDTKKRNQLLTFAQTYRGPHVLMFFVDSTEKKLKKSDWFIVPVDNEVTQKECAELFALLFPEVPVNSTFIKAVYKKYGVLSRDMACLLMYYARLLGKQQVEPFLKEWLDALVLPEQSLFTLSTYLFAKKSEPFFSLWRTLSKDYPPMFWISFWSEQLFRAAHFVDYAHNKQFVPAKKIGYRLPFTFIKHDWKVYSRHELSIAHDFLYRIDYTLKNGGLDEAIDLFYCRFLSNDFARKNA